MVKKEYKETEIGTLPVDWEVIDFEDCFELLPNNTLSRAELNYDFGEVRNVHYGDILVEIPSILDCSEYELPFVNTNNIIKNPRSFLKNGDIIIADTAEDETVGKATEVYKIETKKVVSGLHTIACRPRVEFEPKWLGYFINHRMYHDQLLPYITGTKVSAISKGSIKLTKVVRPLPEEQTAIVEAVDDINQLINSLERLIRKKKAIKKGVMQELLTGKKRLPGFNETWEEVKLYEVVSRFATGLNPRQNFTLNTGGYCYYVTIKNFFDGQLFLDDECDKIDYEALNKINKRSDLQKNDILFSSIGRIGDAYLIKETPENWNINESVFSLRPNKERIEPLFLYYILKSERVQSNLKDSTTGSTLKSIKMSHLKEVVCKIPNSKKEQKEISKILSDMDMEIGQLQEKLNKYQKIKQGMMDELLTGKTRLI